LATHDTIGGVTNVKVVAKQIAATLLGWPRWGNISKFYDNDDPQAVGRSALYIPPISWWDLVVTPQ